MRLSITVPSVALTFDKKLLRRVLGQAGREIVATAKALIGRDGSGRQYGSHHASAPGMPPATFKGLLAKSLSVRTTATSVRITDSAPYALSLESGAVGGGGKNSKTIGRVHRRGGAKGKAATQRIMAPRPYLSVAAEGEMPILQKRIAAALNQGIDLKVLKSAR